MKNSFYKDSPVTITMPLLHCAAHGPYIRGYARHSFEGCFYDANTARRDATGWKEVWHCEHCGARRVWGSRKNGDTVDPVENWQWLPHRPEYEEIKK